MKLIATEEGHCRLICCCVKEIKWNYDCERVHIQCRNWMEWSKIDPSSAFKDFSSQLPKLRIITSRKVHDSLQLWTIRDCYPKYVFPHNGILFLSFIVDESGEFREVLLSLRYATHCLKRSWTFSMNLLTIYIS